jgi:hypothetical protein
VFFAVALLFTFLLAIGPSTPLGWLTYQIPVFNAFRYPWKHLLEVTLCIAVLAGFGAQSVLDGGRAAARCAAVIVGIAITRRDAGP